MTRFSRRAIERLHLESAPTRREFVLVQLLMVTLIIWVAASVGPPTSVEPPARSAPVQSEAPARSLAINDNGDPLMQLHHLGEPGYTTVIRLNHSIFGIKAIDLIWGDGDMDHDVAKGPFRGPFFILDHHYMAAGTYTVTALLRYEGRNGDRDYYESSTMTLTISECVPRTNRRTTVCDSPTAERGVQSAPAPAAPAGPPLIALKGPTGAAGDYTYVQLNNPLIGLRSVDWTWGDGQRDLKATNVWNYHLYKAPGTYTVTAYLRFGALATGGAHYEERTLEVTIE